MIQRNKKIVAIAGVLLVLSTPLTLPRSYAFVRRHIDFKAKAHKAKLTKTFTEVRDKFGLQEVASMPIRRDCGTGGPRTLGEFKEDTVCRIGQVRVFTVNTDANTITKKELSGTKRDPVKSVKYEAMSSFAQNKYFDALQLGGNYVSLGGIFINRYFPNGHPYSAEYLDKHWGTDYFGNVLGLSGSVEADYQKVLKALKDNKTIPGLDTNLETLLQQNKLPFVVVAYFKDFSASYF